MRLGAEGGRSDKSALDVVTLGMVEVGAVATGADVFTGVNSDEATLTTLLTLLFVYADEEAVLCCVVGRGVTGDWLVLILLT